MFKQILSFIYKEIVFNGHLQSMGAVALAVFSFSIFNHKSPVLPLIILYLSFYTFFLYNRYKEMHLDKDTNKDRFYHLSKIIKQVRPIMHTTLILVIVLTLYTQNKNFIILNFLIIVFGFLYTDYFKKVTRHIYVFKNIYVSLVFALLVVYLSIHASIILPTFTYAIAFLIFFHGMFMQACLDLKDIESDKIQKYLTLGAL